MVTVPPYFTQAQRKALLLAGRIANINIVQLLNTNTAVAINYGVFRRSEFTETPQRILFFDMGAGSTTASVIEYTTQKKKGSKQGTAQLEVLGVGFDATLGGLQFDMRLAQHLMKIFTVRRNLKRRRKREREKDREKRRKKWVRDKKSVEKLKILCVYVRAYMCVRERGESHSR